MIESDLTIFCEFCKKGVMDLSLIRLDGKYMYVCEICKKSLITDEILIKFTDDMKKWIKLHNELYAKFVILGNREY